MKIENLNSKRSANVSSLEHHESTSSSQSSKNNQSTSNMQYSIISSQLSEVYVWGGGKILPKIVDTFRGENAPLQVAMGPSHYAVVTVEKEVYTWSVSSGTSNLANAKLGHGKRVSSLRTPKKVDALHGGISIEQVSCGEEVTCFVTDQGDLFIAGTNQYGCLGFDPATLCGGGDEDDTADAECDAENVFVPVEHPFFKEKHLKVKRVACGDTHVIVLTSDNRVFTWGCGEYGQLGHGDENERLEPTELTFAFKYQFRNVFAARDRSFLLTKEGRLLAFGNNECNKLCLNAEIHLKNANQVCVCRNVNNEARQS